MTPPVPTMLRSLSGRASRPATRRTVSSLLLVLTVTTLATTLVTQPSALAAPVEGLQDAGPFTALAAPTVRALRVIGAVGTVGALIVAVVLLAWRGRHPDEGQPLLRAASRWAALWSAAALGSVVLEISQTSGTPVLEVLRGGGLEAVFVIGEQIRGLLFGAWVAAIVAFFARGVQTRAGEVAVLVVAVAGLLPPVITGHSGHADRHVVAVVSMVVHVAAVTAWVGGLLALSAHAHQSTRHDVQVLHRFSGLALVCFAAVGISGLVNALARLSVPEVVTSGAYSGLLLVKVVLFLLLGAVGMQHRRRTLRAVADGRPAAFWALVAGELVVMVTVVALGVVLTSTAPTGEASEGVHAVALFTASSTGTSM